ncbi:MAG: glycosyltransferase family 4 protein [Phycisphaerales bacterium]|nr:glycosyltransferase family 4 protein [Phycisphaerales bacterium]
MHILYIHQYFATPHGNTGTRSFEFAKRWVSAGHRVTMLTSTAQLTTNDLESAEGQRVAKFTISGIDVVALNVPYDQRMGFVRRTWAFSVFMFLACWNVLRIPKVDVIFATSTPLTIAVPAVVGHLLRRIPYVFEVRDLWPDVPVALGYVRNRVIIWMIKRLELMAYRFADAIVALSPGVAQLIEKRLRHKIKIDIIPNCCDTELFSPDVDGTSIREAKGWSDSFVCMHTGAMGVVNGLDSILNAAVHFRNEPAIRFVLIGGGKEKQRLREEVDRRGLKNLDILDSVPKRTLVSYMAACDLALMTVTSVPVLEHNSANKFFDYLSMGKPVVLNYSGWQRELLERIDAGCGCPMGDDDAFFSAIEALWNEPETRARMSTNARAAAENEFSRDRMAQRALESLMRVKKL